MEESELEQYKEMLKEDLEKKTSIDNLGAININGIKDSIKINVDLPLFLSVVIEYTRKKIKTFIGSGKNLAKKKDYNHIAAEDYNHIVARDYNRIAAEDYNHIAAEDYNHIVARDSNHIAQGTLIT